MTAQAKPVPTLRGEERLWFRAAHEGRLMYQQCRQCGAKINYPRVVCPSCFSDDLAEKSSGGRGIIHSFTTQHRPGGPAFADDVPYTIVLVDLDEGVRVVANLVDAIDADIVIGAPVEVFFDRMTDDFTVPRFRLVAGGAAGAPVDAGVGSTTAAAATDADADAGGHHAR